MKFICQRDSILNEIANANEFTSSKSNLSITANVYLETKDDVLIIKATDQKMGYKATIAVQTEDEGNITVKCDKFLNILRSLPNGNICFAVKNSQMYITDKEGKISFNIRTSSEDFPPLLTVEENFFKIPKKSLAKLIDQTAFAASTEETKYFMCGCFLTKEEGNLVMVGTDGKRLSCVKEAITTEIPDFEDITIPNKFVNVIQTFNDNEGEFNVYIDKKIIMIRSNNCEYYSVLLNAPYPNYKKVIPVNQDKFCRIRIKDMDEALKRVSLLVETKFKRVVFQIENERILISTEESDTGMAKEEIPCEFNGTPFKCALNYTYLQAPLRVMEGEYFCIWFNDPTKAFVVKPDPERDYLHVIMPMQVN